MAKVRAALIQAHANMPKEEAIKKHEELIGEAAAKGAQITCLQEIFFGPYFCAEQDPSGTTPPNGTTARRSGGCRRWRRSTRWRWSCLSTKRLRRASITTPRC